MWRGRCCSSLVLAVSQNHHACMERRLKDGADPNQTTGKEGHSLVMVAASKGYAKCIDILANHGADLDFRVGGRSGITACRIAYIENHIECLKVLRRRGALLPAEIQFYEGNISCVASLKGRVNHLRVMLSMGLNANMVVSYTNNIAREIYTKPNQDDYPKSLLMLAALKGSPNSLRVLLEFGADVNAKDGSGRTAYQLAKDNGKEECVRILAPYMNGSSRRSSARGGRGVGSTVGGGRGRGSTVGGGRGSGALSRGASSVGGARRGHSMSTVGGGRGSGSTVGGGVARAPQPSAPPLRRKGPPQPPIQPLGRKGPPPSCPPAPRGFPVPPGGAAAVSQFRRPPSREADQGGYPDAPPPSYESHNFG